jgi:hypothetical protein
MSRSRKRRREGRRQVLYFAARSEELRRRAPPDVLASCEQLPCDRCKAQTLVYAPQFLPFKAAAVALGLVVTVVCLSCSAAARAGQGGPALVTVLRDEGLASRLRQYLAEQN